MSVTQLVRRAGQYFRTSTGTGPNIPAGGAYTAELYGWINGSTGTRTVVTGVAGKRIRVLSYCVNCGAAGSSTYVWRSASTDIGPGNALAANAYIAEADESGLFQTNPGEDLNIVVGAVALAVRVTYILVD